MNILLGNNTYDWLAGSETWGYTLAEELIRLGHRVAAYSPQLGLMATKLEALGVSCISTLPAQSEEARPFEIQLAESEPDPDLIICAHYQITKALRARYPNVRTFSFIHGILHANPENPNEIWPEHPVEERSDKLTFVAVSPEVQEMLKKTYDIDAPVLPNFFNLDRFSYDPPQGDKPKIFMVNSNYWGVDDPIMAPIKEAAEHFGAQIRGIGANFIPTFEVQDTLKGVDVVFGMGRSVLEGACMGKIAIIHGRWGTGGLFTHETAPGLKTISGRDSGGKLATTQELIAMIERAYKTPKLFENTRKYMEEFHNVRIAAKEILETT